eukprot:TRINITY_DN3956_c0_g1_i2.p1 TRINITY_DN3956_c0_g1~~TRINITY_DN3956_c0_g1_i2.p1  ORF type:complete len:442 (-),score=99.92 TRINITY_DN3956_c0_g1_i2:117-1442(-)
MSSSSTQFILWASLNCRRSFKQIISSLNYESFVLLPTVRNAWKGMQIDPELPKGTLVCRYGAFCDRLLCRFAHPQGRGIDYDVRPSFLPSSTVSSSSSNLSNPLNDDMKVASQSSFLPSSTVSSSSSNLSNPLNDDMKVASQSSSTLSPLVHSTRPCRYGASCMRRNCSFVHPLSTSVSCDPFPFIEHLPKNGDTSPLSATSDEEEDDAGISSPSSTVSSPSPPFSSSPNDLPSVQLDHSSSISSSPMSNSNNKVFVPRSLQHHRLSRRDVPRNAKHCFCSNETNSQNSVSYSPSILSLCASSSSVFNASTSLSTETRSLMLTSSSISIRRPLSSTSPCFFPSASSASSCVSNAATPMTSSSSSVCSSSSCSVSSVSSSFTLLPLPSPRLAAKKSKPKCLARKRRTRRCKSRTSLACQRASSSDIDELNRHFSFSRPQQNS